MFTQNPDRKKNVTWCRITGKSSYFYDRGRLIVQSLETVLSWRLPNTWGQLMTKSLQNYAQIVKEMLGIVLGCERLHEYLYGQKSIKVQTDDKPLKAILRYIFRLAYTLGK